MNKQKFVEYLRKPSDLNAQALAQLESLVEEHPYFQSARTLLAKGSKQMNPKKAGNHINSAAIYATDRILLKRYINDELIFLSPLDVHESHEADHERDINEVIKTNKIATAQLKAARESEAPPKKQRITPPQEEPETLPEAPDASELDLLIKDIYREMEELKVNRAKLNEIENKLVEDEAVNDAVERATRKVASKIEVEKEETTFPEELEETPQKNPVLSVEETFAPEEAFEEEEAAPFAEQPEDPEDEEPYEDEVVASESAEPEIREEQEEEPVSVKAETTLPKEEKTEESEANKEERKDVVLKKPSLSRSARVRKLAPKPADTDAESKPAESNSEVQHPKSGTAKDSHRASQSEIIANFIKSNPTITPAESNKTKNDADLSTKSTELHPDIASEYLAEIYLEQGRTERAIQIYEALIVKFPEKSVYFADIIKKINEQK